MSPVSFEVRSFPRPSPALRTEDRRRRLRTDAMSETLDVDVLIVGGGPAGLSAALRLSQLQKAHGGDPLSVAVLEKAREAGAHTLSGAVLDTSALRELIPDCEAKGVSLRRSRSPRSRLLPDAAVEVPVSDRPASTPESRQLHHLAERASCGGCQSRSRPKASMCSAGLPDARCCSTAHASSACGQAIAALRRTDRRSRSSSRAWRSGRRSRSSAMACAET